METIRQNIKINIFQRLNVRHLKMNTAVAFSSPAIKETINKFSILENKEVFYQWLVGFTEGDGTFSIYLSKNTKKINFFI